ncbi:MAG: translocation/assembly module TamB domain-containing protein [Bacteroidales bacterium]|nr:translocation/assembly module TamB domain-containing protein [Bacteroidales bacterium]
MKTKKNKRVYIRRAILTVVLLPVTVLLLLTLFMAFPPVQKYLNTHISSYLTESFGTEVRISRLFVNVFSRRIAVEGILVRDSERDTLLHLGTLSGKISYFSVLDNVYSLDDLSIDSLTLKMYAISDSTFNYSFLSSGNKEEEEDTSNSDPAKYDIEVAKLKITNANFVYSTKVGAEHPGVFDFEDIRLRDINLYAHNVIANDKNMMTLARIDSLRAYDECGFSLNKLIARADFSDKELNVNELTLQCPQTNFKAEHIGFAYSNLDAFSNFVDSVALDVDIEEGSVLGLDDVAYFVPDIGGYGLSPTISLNLVGPVADMKITDLNLSFGEATKLRADARVKGLPDVENLYFDVNIDRLRFNSYDIGSIHVPYDTVAMIELPEFLDEFGNMDFSARASGYTSDCKVKWTLGTRVGDILGDIICKKADSCYNINGDVKAHGLDLGVVASDKETLGRLTTDAKVNVKILNSGDVDGIVDGTVDSVGLMNYYYHNITINGKFTQQSFNGILAIKDPCLDLDFSGAVDVSGLGKYHFDLDINHADLRTTNILADTIDKVSCGLVARLTGNSLDNLNGTVRMSSPFVFEKNSKTLVLNQLDLDAYIDYYVSSIPTRRMVLQSDFVNANLEGRLLTSQVVDILSKFVYVVFPSLDYKGETELPKRRRPSRPGVIDYNDPDFKQFLGNRFDFSIEFRNMERLTDFVMPELFVSNNTTIEGGFSTRRRNSWVNLRTDHLAYEDYTVDSLNILARIYEDNFIFDMHSDSVSVGENIKLKQPSFEVLANNDTASFSFVWDNSSALRNEGSFVGNFVVAPHEIEEHFPLLKTEFYQSMFYVMGNKWDVPHSSIIIDSTAIAVKDLVLRNGRQQLAINGNVSESHEDMLSIDLQEFDLSLLNYFLGNTTIEGHSTGHVSLSNLYGDLPLVEVSNRVDTLRINEVMLGSFTADIDFQPLDSMLVLDFYTLSRLNKKNLHGSGNLDLRTQEIDFTFDIGNLPSRVLRPLFKNYLTVPSVQFLDGITKITGKLDNPIINSNLKLKGGYFKIDYLGVKYTIQNAFNIVVDNKKIVLEKVKLFSGKTGLAYFDGVINHNNFDNFKMNLNLLLKNFTLLDAAATDSAAFWGKAYASGQINISGDPTRMINIDAKVRTDKNTQVFLPLYGASEVSKDFKFIHFKSPEDTIGIRRQHADLSDIRMNFNLEVTPDAEVQAILDATSGNILKASAAGNLKLNVTSSGDFNMYGTLSMERGSYLFSMGTVLSKKFEVVKGGTLRWNGDPMDAIVDIQAMYRLRKVSLYNLMVDERYRDKKVPVQCLLKMRGNLLTPEISFGVKVEENSDVAQGQLDNLDEGNINKQMFSLLLLNQFQPLPGLRSSENSMFSDINPGEIVSNKINHWLSDVTDKVNVGVNYQMGNQSTSDELDVAVSTQLFDDRVSVTTNLGVGGESNNQGPNQRTNSVVGEVEVDVKLNKSGSMTLNVYNKANEDELSEAHYKQGVGLTYRKEFDNFNELWRSIMNSFSPRRREDGR